MQFPIEFKAARVAFCSANIEKRKRKRKTSAWFARSLRSYSVAQHHHNFLYFETNNIRLAKTADPAVQIVA